MSYKMMNAKAVADRLGISVTRVYELCKEPIGKRTGKALKLEPVRMGNGRVLFVEADVEAFYKARQMEFGR